ncbi:hypothetical protein LV89_00580 [Arcicella aurantiaca]|uniref:Lipoprotein n=1 Tax=Arcicella aurantiaca TaxID=591202 RepID=A0A316F0D4_9BACT|nr:hypothetical protein [Arcicella aurantiaca]PWK29026.1 hypothetical protein LV89_00580 [Arcicella aurantiaca]
MKTLFLKLSIVGFVLFSSCTKNDDITNVSDEQKLVNLATEIDLFAKNKTCAGGDDCKVIEMGARPCGGPSRFIIYALSKTDEKQLTEKITAYTNLEKELNVKYNKMGTCEALIPPTVNCLNGVCTSN